MLTRNADGRNNVVGNSVVFKLNSVDDELPVIGENFWI